MIVRGFTPDKYIRRDKSTGARWRICQRCGDEHRCTCTRQKRFNKYDDASDYVTTTTLELEKKRVLPQSFWEHQQKLRIERLVRGEVSSELIHEFVRGIARF